MEKWVADAKSFKPSRWLKDSSDEKLHPFASLPYGYGARMCLGRRFADLEMQVLLAKVRPNTINNSKVQQSSSKIFSIVAKVAQIVHSSKYNFVGWFPMDQKHGMVKTSWFSKTCRSSIYALHVRREKWCIEFKKKTGQNSIKCNLFPFFLAHTFVQTGISSRTIEVQSDVYVCTGRRTQVQNDQEMNVGGMKYLFVYIIVIYTFYNKFINQQIFLLNKKK